MYLASSKQHIGICKESRGEDRNCLQGSNPHGMMAPAQCQVPSSMPASPGRPCPTLGGATIESGKARLQKDLSGATQAPP